MRPKDYREIILSNDLSSLFRIQDKSSERRFYVIFYDENNSPLIVHGRFAHGRHLYACHWCCD